MSSSSSILSPAETLFELNVNTYVSITSFTILFYEYLLTLDQEILTYWGTGLTWATVLFYLNRYMSLVGSLPIVLESFWNTNNLNKLQACHILRTYHQYYAIAAQAFVAAILIMRTYALYERNRRLLFSMLAVAAAAAITGACLIFSGKGDSDALEKLLVEVGCASGLEISSSRRLGYAWTGMLVFDSMIFVLTALKALAASRAQRGGLIFLLIRDGSLYFLVMVASNCGNILSFMYAGPYVRGVGTTFTNVISSIMISRLMLNLRDHKHAGPQRTAESTTLYDAPISTVVEPYYALSTRGAVADEFMWHDDIYDEGRRISRGDP
ncbi:hypothetical protein DFH07DRAFT_826351 [Mycena maculata]|uniref:DUF6533 domain-containing protein n=1 Tax=Mycena maculata TaxID=230809 RepID=A0AAD7NA01_9AGAR|nr:hypothetical protein DFH07DRAFT_826351 [Mycena maculata]